MTYIRYGDVAPQKKRFDQKMKPTIYFQNFEKMQIGPKKIKFGPKKNSQKLGQEKKLTLAFYTCVVSRLFKRSWFLIGPALPLLRRHIVYKVK